MKATEFVNSLGITEGATREMMAMNAIVSNQIPSFLWTLHPVTVGLTTTNPTDGSLTEHTLTYRVMPDYLCVGEDDDYMHVPLSPITANSFMDQHGFSLPTKKMVNQIWEHCDLKIRPVTWDEMYGKSTKKYNRGATRCFFDHSQRIQQIVKLSGQPPEALRAGHKKDVVLSNALLRKENLGNVAIYGWFNPDGTPIQGLNPKSHVVSYTDYSHGLRMVSNACVLDGQPTTLQAIWSDPVLCQLIHDEPLRFRRY